MRTTRLVKKKEDDEEKKKKTLGRDKGIANPVAFSLGSLQKTS